MLVRCSLITFSPVLFLLSLTHTGTAAAAAAGPALSTKAVAVVLGYAVLIGSCFRSVPQILKVRLCASMCVCIIV